MKGFMIAATASGTGKSTVTMGLNRLLHRKGYKVQPWKCGPDYIDPGFHSQAAQRYCRNLDTRLIPEDRIKALFCHHASDADISVVEGVMGYYDGDAGRYEEGSSYHLSRVLNLPVFMVLDIRSTAQSAGAMALGFQKFKDDAPIAGFILNRAGSERHAAMVKDAVQEATGLPVIAVLPRRDDLKLPERHLGLVLASEQAQSGELDRRLDALADLMEKYTDMDQLLALSSMPTPEISGSAIREIFPKSKKRPHVKIALARDDAFAFYYQDNLDMLTSRGAELVPFSPVKDEKLPEGCCAVYFGGGYPERFARELAGNISLIEELRQYADRGMPIYGECGGYMYLAESLRTQDGELWPMTGLLPGKITMTGGLRALGYGNVHWNKDTAMAPAGSLIPGHLFHWSCLEEPVEEETLFSIDRKGETLNEGYIRGSVCASYIHFHFASAPFMADNFIKAAETYKNKILKESL